MTRLRFVEDENGDAVDIIYYHNFCGPLELSDIWPCPDWPDYPVYCGDCGGHLHG